MIQIERHHDSGSKKTLLKVASEHPLGVLLHIAAVELPLGAEIIHKGGNHHHNKVMVRTPLSSGADVSVYRGAKRDMEIIHDFTFFNTFTNFDTEVVNGETVFADERMKRIDPEIVHLLTHNEHRTSVATLLACGITCPKEIHAHHTKSMSDIIGAVDLVRENRAKSISEVFAA